MLSSMVEQTHFCVGCHPVG